MRIALAQINPIVGDLSGNKKRIETSIKEALNNKVDILIFPELAICGYPPEDLLLKDHFIKDNIKILKQIATKVSRMTVVLGFVDQKENKLFNAAAVIENKKVKHVYHKQCLPNYGVFDEKRYFANGEKNLIFDAGTRHGAPVPCAVNICEDIWDDTVSQQLKSKAEIIINISCSPFDMGKFAQREKVMKKRAKEVGAYVFYCNVVGGQDELVFDGGSMVVDPKGKVIGLAKEFEEDLLIANLYIGETEKNLNKVKTPIHKPSPVLDRVYKALVLGLRDYAGKNGFTKVVLGISGGVDSALVAAIAVKALGKNNVIGITMPSQYSSPGTQSDARILAANLDIELKELPIENVFKAYLHELEQEFKGHKSDMAEENIQARIRGNFIMALSNKFGWLVLATGNKSELAVGYCTLYGDMSGGFALIKDVPKTLVFKLCKHINKRENNIIPESIITRPPSAELRDNQKDQDSLPEYDDLDEIMTDYVQEYKSFSKMSYKKDLDVVKKVMCLIDRNEYKRRQAPPGIKITPRAFGKDWRLPITNKYREF